MFSKLRARLGNRCRAEDGAVTVDWVVLTALVIAMCLAMAALMTDMHNASGASFQQKISATP